MAILVVLVLAILWAAVLLPPILRSRSEAGSSPGGVGDFLGKLRSGLGHGRQHEGNLPPLQPIMGPVGGPTPSTPMGPVHVPGGMSPTQRRRRDVLLALAAAAAVTFVMALMAGSMVFWLLHLLADALLGGYVYLLLQFKARQAERNQKVRPLATQPVATPANVLSLDDRRRPVASHISAPRGSAVLALRRTASW